MSTVATQPTELNPAKIAFATAVVLLAAGACALAGWAPISFSICTVFLFAGPHNWLEARYMIGRMPPKWGSLRPFFVVGIAGVLLLFLLFASLPLASALSSGSVGASLGVPAVGMPLLVASWNTLFIGWVLVLAMLRCQQPPRRNWGWLLPVGFALMAVNWLGPYVFSMALVYLHPLLALVFLDRELAKRKPAWLRTYRVSLLCVPLLLGLLVANLATTAAVPADTTLAMQISRHAGSSIAGDAVSSHLLIACHTFLEMLHYGVWVLAIPLLSVRRFPWQLDNVALAKKSGAWLRLIQLAVLCGGLVMIALWAAFLVDFETTRHIYFTVALLHVLAEFPFLLRQL